LTTSYTRIHGIGLALLLVAGAGPEAGLGAQEPEPGRVVGTVVDSTTMRTLPNAAVVLWGTSHQTVSDSLGRFQLEDVPPGEYSVAFFHTRLGRLGVSVGPTPVVVRPGATVGADLAIPSTHTLEAMQCAFDPAHDGVAVGQVTDPESGTGLPSVRVRFTWPGAAGEREESIVRSSPEGWYHVCDLPRGRRVAVTASFLDRGTSRQEIVVNEEPVHLDLPMHRVEMVDVNGRLVDADSGDGIGEATVGLAGTGFRVVSEPDGEFHFRQVLPGQYTLEASHIAYGDREESIEVASAGGVRVEMALSQRPIELPPVTVEVEAENMMDMAMGGTVITEEELDRVRDRSRDLLDLLQNQNMAGLITRRQGADMCIGFLPGQARMMFRSNCVSAVVFVDNVRASNPRMAVDLPAEIVERVVLFRPVEAGNLFGLGGGNGVVMIFTKR
jgi:hypothetical protein